MTRTETAVLALLLLSAVAASPAAAAKTTAPPSGNKANWSIGANLELGWVNPEVGATSTVLAWPSDVSGLQPGVRVGYTKESTPSEFYLDTGLALITGGGASVSDFELTANYQYNFIKKGAPPKSMTPYLTAGLGLFTSSFNPDIGPDEGATSLVYGLGAGLRHRVADGHGSIRTEVRFDHVTEGDDNGDVVIQSSNVFGIKVGFDLWMK